MTNAASPIGPGPISPGESGWALAWRMARREIRGSVARFRVFPVSYTHLTLPTIFAV